MKKNINQKPTQPLKQHRPTGNELCVSLEIPVNGLRIKLHDDGYNVIGTLVVSKVGLVVMEPNQKKPPESFVNWTSIAKLMNSGLLK